MNNGIAIKDKSKPQNSWDVFHGVILADFFQTCIWNLAIQKSTCGARPMSFC
jgi:hypothetical protein